MILKHRPEVDGVFFGKRKGVFNHITRCPA